MAKRIFQNIPAEEADKFIPKGYNSHLYCLRHSAAHVMAQAVCAHFAKAGLVKMGGGPPVENGFYYDFELPRAAVEEDLPQIENIMREIIRGKHPFVYREVTGDEARVLFKDQPYKLELIEGLMSGKVDDNGNPLEGVSPQITTYTHDTFTDLCRGPHVNNSIDIDPEAIKSS